MIGDYIKKVIVPSVFIICIMGIIFLSYSFLIYAFMGGQRCLLFLIVTFIVAIGLIL